MWDNYHIFLIAPLLFTRLLLDEIYQLVELLFDWLMTCVDCCMLFCWFEFRFCYSYLTWETGGLEFASTIILVLQANRLTNSAFSQNQDTLFHFSRKSRKDLPQLLPLIIRKCRITLLTKFTIMKLKTDVFTVSTIFLSKIFL